MYIFNRYSLNYSQNEKFFGQFCRESQFTNVMFSNFLRAVCEIMGERIAGPG